MASLRTAVRRLSVLARYDAAIAAGLKPDPVQRAAAAELARLHEQVNVYASTLERYERELRDWKAVRRRHEDRQRQLEAEAAAAEARRPALVKWAAAAMQRFSPPPAAANEGCSSGGSCASGSSCASAELDGLSTEERRHPFWTSGLGSKLVKRAAPPPPPDGGSGPPSAHAAAAGAANDLPPLPLPPIRPPAPQGLFLHGPVGAGKTLLMDMFAASVADGTARTPLNSRRVHFNSFLIECHRRLHTHTSARAALDALTTAPPQARATADVADAAAGGCRSSSATSWPAPAPENGAAAASGGDAGGGWHVVTALVRRLVTESADGGVRPERRGDLSAALDAISQSITSQGEGGGGDAGDGGGGDGVLDDEHGRPVAPGVLCFDEVQMMDVADAVIVTGVFQRLFEAGWVLVCTCNRTVDEFAASALHREHPHARFTRDVAKFCAPLDLGSLADGREPQDYRQSLPPADETTLFNGDTGGAAALEARFAELTKDCALAATTVPTAFGRSVSVLASPSGVARASFDALCGDRQPLGAADYIALAERFHTLVVPELPAMTRNERHHARRFITMVDQLYNHRVRLITSTRVALEDLFQGGAAAGGAVDDLEGLEFEGEAGKAPELNPIGATANPLEAGGSTAAAAARSAATARVAADSRKALVRDAVYSGEDETFAFHRALSRLREMQSAPYLDASRSRMNS